MRKTLLNVCLLAATMLMSTAGWALDKVDGVYQIGTAADLKAFADLVNSGETYACAVLTADIDYGIESTMIGMDMPDGTTSWYNGRFDGQGHTVKLEMFPTANGGALFQNVGYQGRVTRVMTTGNITTEFKFAAGIAGWNRGVITRCATTVNVNSAVSGDGTHGGIVGVSQANSMVADCLSAMTITTKTTTMCGGIIGWSEGKTGVENCLNINDFQFSDANGSAVVSRNGQEGGYVSQAFGVYYVKPFGDLSGGTQITEDDVKSGKACFLLNNDQSKIIWTQKIGEDPYPLPFGDRGQVYCSANTNCDGTTDVEGATYSNSPAGGTPTKHVLTAGFCSECKGYTTSRRHVGPSTHNENFTGYWDPYFIERDDEGWYLVKTADDLLWLANTEPINNEYFNCKFMNDIDYSQNNFWLNWSNWYYGIVDGQGHKMTIDIGPVTESWSSGITPKLSGTVRNLWIDGHIDQRATGGGSVCGQPQNNAALIENVLSTVVIESTVAGDGTHGGFVGRSNTQITLRNCIFAGQINGEGTTNCGGLVGWCGSPTFFQSCIQAGTFTVGDANSNTIGRYPTNIRMVDESKYPNYYLNTLGDTPASAHEITEDELQSGALTYLLNLNQADVVWTQTIGTDSYPVPFNNHAQVYADPQWGYQCDGTPLGAVSYTNTPQVVTIPDHLFDNGFCTECGTPQPGFFQPNADGVYEIRTGHQLAWLSQYVLSSGNGDVDIKLMNNIDMGEANEYFHSIGTEKTPYSGHFDGQGYTISNLSVNEPSVSGVGLIGTIWGSTDDPAIVENVILDESCSIRGYGYCGVVGFSLNKAGAAIIRCVGNEGPVECFVGANAGGVLGCSMGSAVQFTLENCYCTGSIIGPTENAQLCGWIGSNGIVNNCWSTSSVENARADDNQFIARSSVTVTNSYSNRAGGEGGIALKVVKVGEGDQEIETYPELESGELTYKLNGSQWGDHTWYQTIGEDSHPVLKATHGQVWFYNKELGSVITDFDFHELRQRIKDTESSWIDSDEFIAEEKIIEDYREIIEGVDGCNTMKELYTYVTSMDTQKKALETSANAYKKYMDRAEELRGILTNDQSFSGEDREILAAYLDGDEEPGELYPNGAYYRIVDYREMTADQITDELAFMNQLYQNAVKYGYIQGTEITDLLVNPKFVDAFSTGWEGVLASGKTSADLSNGTFVGAEAWAKTFDMHQTLHEMKDGLYLLRMNAAQRSSSSLNTQSLNYTSSIYVNDNMTYVPAAVETYIPLADAVDQVNANITGATADLVLTDEEGETLGYYLHGQLSMAIAANSERSYVYMVAKAKDGDLTVGVKNPGAKKGNDWMGFANTALWYCGDDMNSDVALQALDQALQSQLDRANTMLLKYEPFIDDNYAIQPNYSAELQDELATLVQKAESITDGEAKYELIGEFSDLFERIYDCKMAYVEMFKNSILIEHVARMLSGEMSDEELMALFQKTADLQEGYMDGKYSKEQAENPEGMESVMAYVPEQDANGVYQLKDKYNVAYFAAMVNSIAPASNAVLCNDIDMKNIEFVGIGTPSSKYNGTFDGQGHTISNLTVDGGQYVGFFGQVTDCTIKRFILDKTCTLNGEAFIGIVGGTNGACTVNLDQLGFEGTATGTAQNVSGIIGCNMGSTATFIVSNCYVTGDISGGRESATITGWSGGSQSSFTNCWSTGSISGNDAAGQFYRNADTQLSNCYDIFGEQSGISKLTDDMLRSGTFTYNTLNGGSSENPIWFQKLGTDTIPRLFTGDIVYKYAGEFMNEKPVIELNSYAYDVKTASDENSATVYYTLNSPAKAAQIDFYAGETKVYTEELAGDDLTQGEHSVTIENSKLGEKGTAITFNITVESLGVLEAAPVGESMKFWSPYGMAINNNPESSTFGIALVSESATHPNASGYISDQRKDNQGIYAFTPQLESIPAADGIPGFTGGLDLSTDRATKTIRISEDGRLFIGNQSGTTNSPIYEANLEDLNADWNPLFTGGTLDEESGITYIGEEMQVARVSSFDVVGKGDDLKLYTLEGDQTGFVDFQQDHYYSHIYNLGSKTQWDGLPTSDYEPLTVNHWTIAPNPVNILCDKRGGIWYIQYRSAPTETVPAMKHYDATGKEDYSNVSRSMPGGGMAMNADGSLIVFPTASSTVTIYSVDYAPMENGMIFMTGVATIPTTHDGSQLTAIGLDYANNVWVASNGTETLTRYVAPEALPDNKVTTPSNSRANFTVGEMKTGIQKVNAAGKDEIYTIGGVKVEKAQKGVNIVNGKKVIVK